MSFDIRLKNVTLSYGSFKAVERLTGEFQSGSLTAIIGPNGGGKTTLIKALMGFVKPSSGSITFQKMDASDIAYMPQKTDIDLSFPLTVREVAGMGLLRKVKYAAGYKSHDLDQIQGALRAVGLENKTYNLLHTLSYGQLQRLLFARLMLQDRPIVILDEPFASIDLHTKELLLNLIQKWNIQKKTIIVILHDLDLVGRYFPQTLLLAQKPLAWGPTSDVVTDHNLSLAFKRLLEMKHVEMDTEMDTARHV